MFHKHMPKDYHKNCHSAKSLVVVTGGVFLQVDKDLIAALSQSLTSHFFCPDKTDLIQ